MKWSELLAQKWQEADNGHGCYGYNLFFGDEEHHFIMTCDGENAPDYPVDGEPAVIGLYDCSGYMGEQRTVHTLAELNAAMVELLDAYEKLPA